MKMILVPLDSSLLAERILPYVRLLATALRAEVHLLHVVADDERAAMLTSDYAVVYELAGPQAAERVREQRLVGLRRQHAQRYLNAQAELLREAGVSVVEDVRFGEPAECIVAAAEHLHADLIAMATHGYSGVRRWALGSVADKVVQTTRTPLLLVRDAEHAPPPRAQLRRLLVPLDGSDLARQALPLATDLAMSAAAELVLLQAIAPSVEAYPGVALPSGVQLALREQAQRELDALAGELRPFALRTSTAVLPGSPAEVIVDEAVRRQADVIVMATHGYGGLRRWALGSVADKVLHATTTPLLLVRAR